MIIRALVKSFVPARRGSVGIEYALLLGILGLAVTWFAGDRRLQHSYAVLVQRILQSLDETPARSPANRCDMDPLPWRVWPEDEA
jgi:hypothetical protein